MVPTSPEIGPNRIVDSKERMENIKIGVAIGSGGVYAAAGLGVLETMENNGLEIPYVGGASGGAIISAVYFLEGNATSAKEKLLQKLPDINDIKLSPFGKPMSGERVRQIINDILDDRDWEDGKLDGVCFGAAFQDTKKAVILSRKSGLSLADSVLASVSLKMIKSIVKLDGRTITHGGDPDYIEGLRTIGADFVIEVAPNLEDGAIGKVARTANAISSALILKGDYMASQKPKVAERADYAIRPNLSLKPLVSPLNFSMSNTQFMIERGRVLTEQSLPSLKEVISSKNYKKD